MTKASERNTGQEAAVPKTSTPATSPARVLSPFDELDRLFDRFLERGWMPPMRWSPPLSGSLFSSAPAQLPKVDVIDNDKDILVRAELPGVDRKDVDVSVNDSSVTIKAQTRSEDKTEEGDYYRCEIHQGSFSRTIGLPGEVDADKAEAKMNDGILELRLPKLKSARRRKVDVI